MTWRWWRKVNTLLLLFASILSDQKKNCWRVSMRVVLDPAGPSIKVQTGIPERDFTYSGFGTSKWTGQSDFLNYFFKGNDEAHKQKWLMGRMAFMKIFHFIYAILWNDRLLAACKNMYYSCTHVFDGWHMAFGRNKINEVGLGHRGYKREPWSINYWMESSWNSLLFALRSNDDPWREALSWIELLMNWNPSSSFNM